MQIVILKLRQKTTVTAADHDQRHWKAAKVKKVVVKKLIFKCSMMTNDMTIEYLKAAKVKK